MVGEKQKDFSYQKCEVLHTVSSGRDFFPVERDRCLGRARASEIRFARQRRLPMPILNSGSHRES